MRDVLGQQVHCVGHEDGSDGDHSGYEKQLKVFHRWKQAQKSRAKMRSADAIGISGERQKWEDRRGADHLKDGLHKREQKNPSQLRSAVWARQKENATKEVGNVMNKRGHVSGLHVQEIGGITSRNAEVSQLSAGKLNCQRSRDD